MKLTYKNGSIIEGDPTEDFGRGERSKVVIMPKPLERGDYVLLREVDTRWKQVERSPDEGWIGTVARIQNISPDGKTYWVLASPYKAEQLTPFPDPMRVLKFVDENPDLTRDVWGEIGKGEVK